MATLLDDLFDQALSSFVTESTLESLVEQWRAERAEIAAQQAQFMSDFRLEMNEFREEHNQRERERDERERERDERERQRVRDQEGRDDKMRQWVVGAVSLGFAATTLAVGLLVAFG